jgi:hypothetical protein
MTAEEDRRDGRRITDNQLIAWQAEGKETHDLIEKDISYNSSLIAEVKDDITFLKAEIADFRDASCRQFEAIGDCIGDLKAWQHAFDREKEAESEAQDFRDKRDEKAYEEILENFRFQKRFRKTIAKIFGAGAAIIGAALAILGLWEQIRHLFHHASP